MLQQELFSAQEKHLLAVDCVIPGYERGELNLLLFKCHLEPEKVLWSLIGGWEPDWFTTTFKTQWEQGSQYENTTSERAHISTVKTHWDTEFYPEYVHVECASRWGTHPKYVTEGDTKTYAYCWSSCESIPLSVETTENQASFSVYQNPFNDQLNPYRKNEDVNSIQISTLDGKVTLTYDAAAMLIDATSWQQGTYIIRLLNKNGMESAGKCYLNQPTKKR